MKNVDVVVMALTKIATNPCLYPEGNVEIAARALSEYWGAWDNAGVQCPEKTGDRRTAEYLEAIGRG
jgi:hypothetical protein